MAALFFGRGGGGRGRAAEGAWSGMGRGARERNGKMGKSLGVFSREDGILIDLHRYVGINTNKGVHPKHSHQRTTQKNT
jgi:hypothetical protein